MLFSIIVPIFRVEKFLRQCIDSIIVQDFKDYELILVDDGSDDLCPEICDDYAQKDNRIIVIHKDNGGLVSARKVGCQHARGQYIINIDGDDWICKNYLFTIASAIEDGNNPDIVMWGTTLCGDKQVVNREWTYDFGILEGKKLDFLKSVFLYDSNKVAANSGSVSINLCTKAVKTELYKLYQMKVPNDTTKGEDALLSYYLLSRCQSVYYLDYYGYCYRYVAQSMSKGITSNDFRKLENLVALMNGENTGVSRNQINIYCLWRLTGLFSLLSKSGCSKKEFVDIANQIDNELLNKVKSAEVSKIRFRDTVKMYLINHRYYSILYYILQRL